MHNTQNEMRIFDKGRMGGNRAWKKAGAGKGNKAETGKENKAENGNGNITVDERMRNG